ncbi:MAG: acyl-ACP--UDP-N-acetylglucosamine O-acyltransferase [Candidatus Sericytochromatia bacterium]
MRNKILSLKKEIKIHPTALIDESVILSEGVEIGAFSIIGKNVNVGKNTKIASNVLIDKNTIIGEDCNIYHGAVLGSDSQDLKAEQEKNFLIIGNNNIIREYVTINRASKQNDKTIIGNNNSFLSYTHVGHDCIIGDNNVFSNSVNIGGHCVFESNIVVGGITGFHQFVKVGSFAMIGGMTRVTQDIPPYFVAVGNPLKIESVNIIGLKRQNFSLEKIALLRQAWKIIYNSDFTFSEALKKLDELNSDEINYLKIFLNNNSKRGIAGLF